MLGSGHCIGPGSTEVPAPYVPPATAATLPEIDASQPTTQAYAAHTLLASLV